MFPSSCHLLYLTVGQINNIYFLTPHVSSYTYGKKIQGEWNARKKNGEKKLHSMPKRGPRWSLDEKNAQTLVLLTPTSEASTSPRAGVFPGQNTCQHHTWFPHKTTKHMPQHLSDCFFFLAYFFDGETASAFSSQESTALRPLIYIFRITLVIIELSVACTHSEEAHI